MPEPIDLNANRKAKVKPADAPRRPPRGEDPPQTVKDAAKDAAPEEARRPPRDRKLAASIAQFYGVIGVGLAGVGQGTGNMGLAVAGVNISAKGEETAEAWLDLAEKSPAVRRALEGFAEGSAMAAVVGMHVTMVAPILLSVRNDVVPPFVANMVWNGCLAGEAQQAAVLFGMAKPAEEAPAA